MGYSLSTSQCMKKDPPQPGWNIDLDLITSPQFASFFEDRQIIQQYVDQICKKRLKKLPIVSYIENKQESDILYSHPEYIHKRNESDHLTNINDYTKIPQDSANKWYENFNFQNAILINYIYSIHRNVELKDTINSQTVQNELKNILENEMNKINHDEKLKEKYFPVKMILNTLNMIKIENLKETVPWALTLYKDMEYMLDNYLLIFLFKDDLHLLYSKIDSLINGGHLEENQMYDICKIILYVSLGFKFFHGMLYAVYVIESLGIEFKFFFDFEMSKMNSKIRMEFISKNESRMELVENTELANLTIQEGTSGAMSSEYIYIYNPSKGMTRLHQILNNKQSRYVMINTNTTAFGNKPGTVFAYNNSHVIFFSNEGFKTDTPLFEIYDGNSLEKAEKYHIELDEPARKILYTKSGEFLKSKIFIEGDEIKMTYTSKNVAAFYDSNILYIIYPLREILPTDTEKYFSSDFIYACDALCFSQKGTTTIFMSHHSSSVFKGASQWASEPMLDRMFESVTMNKFLVKSGFLVSSEGQCIYDMVYNTCYSESRKLFEKVDNSNKCIMLSVSSRKGLEYTSPNRNHVMFLTFNEDERENLVKRVTCSVKDYLYDTMVVDTPFAGDLQFDFVQHVKSLNEKMREHLKESPGNNIFNHLLKCSKYTQSPSNEMKHENKESFATYILSNLAMNSNLKLLQPLSNIASLDLLLKFPFILNIEEPTLKQIGIMIDNYIATQEIHKVKLYSLLILLEKHLRKIQTMGLHLTMLYEYEREIVDMARQMMKVISVVSDDSPIGCDIKSICYVIVFDIVSSVDLTGEIGEDLVELLSVIIEVVFKSECFTSRVNYFILSNFLRLMSLKSCHYPILIKNKILNESILHLLDLLCNDSGRQSIASSEDFMTAGLLSSFKEFFKEFYVWVNQSIGKGECDGISLSKDALLECYHQMNRIIFHRSREVLTTNPEIISIPNHLTLTLLNFVISYSSIIELTNLFVIKNWSVILDIIILFSKQRSYPYTDHQCMIKHDIIIDNLQFGNNEKEKSYTFLLNENDKKDRDRSITKNQTLYIESIVINSTNTRRVIAKIKEFNKEEKVLAAIYSTNNDQLCYSSTYEIPDVDMNQGVKIVLINEDDNNRSLFKIRIANYKFSDKVVDRILNPLVILFNRMMRLISFYENSTINKSLSAKNDDELLQLYSTRLFSGGMRYRDMKQYEDSSQYNDFHLFLKELKDNSQYFHNSIGTNLLPSLGDTVQSNELKEEEMKYEFNALVSQDQDTVPYTILFKVFDQIMKYNRNLYLFTGVIPEKLVRAAFFIVIKQERMFDIVDAKVVELFPSGEGIDRLTQDDMLELVKSDEVFSMLFCIWKECCEMRKFYKNKKDAMYQADKTDQEIETYFDNVLQKLKFLYYLNPVGEEKNAKKPTGKFKAQATRNFFSTIRKEIQLIDNKLQDDSLLSKAKAHVTNISHIAKTDTVTLTNLSLGFEYINLKAKFREISLLIMINICKVIEDPEVKVNFISNFYQSFMLIKSDDDELPYGIPSIFSKLNGASEKFGRNITYLFHQFLKILLDEISCVNSCVDSNFILSAYLNAMIWKIRGRDFPFFGDCNFFEKLYTKPQNELIAKANRLLFIIPEVDANSELNKKFGNHSEFRPLDIGHISKLLTDIFILYSNLIIRRVVKEVNISSSSESELNKPQELVKAKSRIKDFKDDILSIIFYNFDEHLGKILEVFLMNVTVISPEELEKEVSYHFPNFREIDLEQYNIKYIQKKMNNLLTNFFKVVVSQEEGIKEVFQNFQIWGKIFLLLIFANEKNLLSISQLLKIFFNNITDVNELMYFSISFRESFKVPLGLDEIFPEKNSNNLSTAIHFILGFLTKIPRHHEIWACLKYFQTFKRPQVELNVVVDMIIDLFKCLLSMPDITHIVSDYIVQSKEFYLLKAFNVDLNSISKLRSVRSNTKLKMQAVKSNVMFDDKDLDVLVKPGYFVETRKGIENEKTYVILMKEPPSREAIKKNQPNYLLSHVNDIIAVDDGSNAFYNEGMVKIVLTYLEEFLIHKHEYTPGTLLTYIRIVRYINKILRYDTNEENKKQIKDFLVTHCEFIRKFSYLKSSQMFPFSIISAEKLENWLMYTVNNYNIQIDPIKIEKFSFDELAIEKGEIDIAAAAKKIYGRFNSTSRKIILCVDSLQNMKWSIPYVDWNYLDSIKDNSDVSKIEDRIYDVIVIDSPYLKSLMQRSGRLTSKMILLPDQLLEPMTETMHEEFSSALSEIFDIDSCILVINAKFFSRIPKKCNFVGYNSLFFDTTTIILNQDRVTGGGINSILYKTIKTQTEGMRLDENSDIVQSLLSDESSQTSLFDFYTQKYELNDITGKKPDEKAEKKQQICLKDIKQAITIEDRKLEERKLFKDIFRTFPIQNSQKSDATVINGVGLFLLKQEMRFLHVIHSASNKFSLFDCLTELTAIKCLFYQKFFNRKYYNIKDDYEMIRCHLQMILEKNLFEAANEDDTCKRILSVIIGENIFDYDLNPQSESMIIDQTQLHFLIQVFSNLFELKEMPNNDPFLIETLILKLINQLFEESVALVKKSNLEGLLNFYLIVQEIFKLMKKDSLSFKIVKLMNESLVFNSIVKYVLKSFNDKEEKSEFYAWSFEFVIFIVNHVAKKGIIDDKTIGPDELMLFRNSEIMNISKSMDIVENQLKSRYACERLIQKFTFKSNIQNIQIKLPVMNEHYAVTFTSNSFSKLGILPDSPQFDNMFCVQELNDARQLKNPQIILPHTSVGLVNQLPFLSKKILFTNDFTSKLEFQILTNVTIDANGNTNQGTAFEVMKTGINLKNIHNIISLGNSTLVVYCDHNLYFKGEFCGKKSLTEFSTHEQLEKIAKETIIAMDTQMILTDCCIYLLGAIELPCENVFGDVKRIKLPLGAKVINAKFTKKNIVCWTTDGHVYAMGENKFKQISKGNEKEYKEFTLMKMPSNLICLDADVKEDAFAFLMKDTSLDENVVYASGKNKAGHYCLPSSIDWQYFSCVNALNHMNIVKIGLKANFFVALSQDNRLFGCGEPENESIPPVFEPKEDKYFASKGLQIISICITSRFVLVKAYNPKKQRSGLYVVGTIEGLPVNPKNPLEPGKVKLFPDKTMYDNFDILSSVVKEDTGIYFVARNYVPLLSNCSIEKIDHNVNRFIMLRPINKEMKMSYYELEGYQSENFYSFSIKKITDLATYEPILKEKMNIDAFNDIEGWAQNLECKVIEVNPKNSVENFHLMGKISLFARVIPYSDQLIVEKVSTSQSEAEIAPVSVLIKYFREKTEKQYVPLNICGILNEQGMEENREMLVQKEKFIENCIKQIDEQYLEQYINSKKIYKNSANEKYSTFEEYLHDKYDNFDRFCLMNSRTHYLIIQEIISLIESAMDELIQRIGIKYDTFASRLIVNNIKYLNSTIRDMYYNQGLASIKRTSNKLDVEVNRAKILRLKNRNLVDHSGEYTMLSQLYQELKSQPGSAFAMNKNDILFTVRFQGEGATDLGGPYRVTLTSAFEDLQSQYMELLIPTPNNSSKAGVDRDKWTINSIANNELCLNLFKFLGKLLGFVILSETFVPLSLPSFIWKQILNLPLDFSDIETLDIVTFNSIIKVLSYPEKYKNEMEDLMGCIDFTCMYSNGSVVELIKNGKNIKLSRENYKGYLDLYLNARYSECREQIKSIQAGLWEVIPETSLKFLSWEDLEVKVCGITEFDLHLFKKQTKYREFHENDRTINFFWQFMENCTLEEKYQYLKFVWGRSRLPKDPSGFGEYNHTITKYHGRSNNQADIDCALPVAHTCFFKIDLPTYSTYEILRYKLLYAIKNSFVINDDRDMNDFNVDELN